MCINVFVWQAHPLYPFLLLLNRDEFHQRATKPLSWWEDSSEILGGRDEVAGGTWLACTKQGKLAFITNVMESVNCKDPEAKSRGQLPVRFLKSKKSPMEFAEEVKMEADQYNGFNLILTDLCSKSMVYISNRPKDEPISIQDVTPGIHVLTNAKLDSPWPKAQRLDQNFKELFYKHGEEKLQPKDMVEKLMTDRVKADETKLPNICSKAWELQLSSVFVDTETSVGRYGTRSTAAVIVTANGEVSFYEKYIEKEEWKELTVNYEIEKVKKISIV